MGEVCEGGYNQGGPEQGSRCGQGGHGEGCDQRGCQSCGEGSHCSRQGWWQHSAAAQSGCGCGCGRIEESCCSLWERSASHSPSGSAGTCHARCEESGCHCCNYCGEDPCILKGGRRCDGPSSREG